MKRTYLFIMGILCLYPSIFHAQNSSLYYLDKQTIDSPVEHITVRDKFPETVFNGYCFLLLKFKKIPKNYIHKKLLLHKIILLKYISNKTYLAQIPDTSKLRQLHDIDITAILSPNPQSKINLTLVHTKTEEHTQADEQVQIVARYSGGNQALSALSAFQIEHIDTDKQLITLNIYWSDIDKLAALPFIHSIAPSLPAPIYTAHNGRGQHHIDYVQRIEGLTGKNVTVGIGDRGRFEHIDGQHRTINYDTLIDYHGSLISGVIGGSGNIRESWRGMAPACNLLTTAAQQVLDSLPVYYANHDVVLTNNSYKFNSFFCHEMALYNLYSGLLDDQLMAYPEVMHVFSAANDALVNTNGCNGYPPKYQTVASFYNAGKNPLTVAGIRYDNKPYASSGRGPTVDGRIKPEITAKALNVYGAASITGNFNKYTGGNGVSFAVPFVVGTMALMYEQYNKIYGQHPSGALVKSIACNSADDIGNPGPDYTYGFGRINAKAAIEVIKNGQFYSDSLSHNEIKTHTISMPAGVRELRVMLYWHDEAGSETAPKMLINDLDISLTTPDSTSYLPWVLDPSPTGCTLNATRSIDTLNNIEQITLSNPAEGDYTIQVKGSLLPFGKKEFFVNYTFKKENIIFSYPIGNDGIRAEERTHLYWTAMGDSSTFSLAYSLNDGIDWIPIKDSILGTNRYYQWAVPDVFSDQARLKIERNNEVVISERFSISERPVVTITPYCNEAADVCWNQVPGAEKYVVYQLLPTDTFMQAIDTIYDLCYRAEIVDTLTYWYSVRAVFNHGQSGERAYARKVEGAFISSQKIDIQIDMLLEGPYMDSTDLMRTALHDLKLLPAQSYGLPAGQPYNIPPWNYSGTEGTAFSSATYDLIAIQNDSLSVVDWVLVTFGTDVLFIDILEQRAALLLENGRLFFPDPTPCLPDDVPIYIRVQHRNHIAAISAQAVEITANVLAYDFSAENSYNFNGISAGQKEVRAGVWALFAGDSSQADNLEGYDINGKDKAYWSEENGIFGRYLNADFNLNGTTDGADKVFWSNNNGTYSNVIKE